MPGRYIVCSFAACLSCKHPYKSRVESVYSKRDFKFLGFAFGKGKDGVFIRAHAKSLKKAKQKLKELTRTRVKNLMKLGLPEWRACEVAYSRKACWLCAKHASVNMAISGKRLAKKYLRQFGTVQEAWFPLGGRDNVRTLLKDRTIAEIAKATGKTPAQVVLRWELQSDIVAIPGSADERHIKENLDILEFELSMDEMSRINALESRRFYQFSDRQAEAMFTSWRPDFEGQK